ncbi:hypothetical protein EDC90_103027 [Martelella mediterranea]|uniref:Uncharacterized protein n=1 Tax=Martelella mediterranea TaxID=293089 RepID=A0A4R3NIG9_9HYPH|nr:hypothetical protein EDC90_103027 [Martelella mediterranea]
MFCEALSDSIMKRKDRRSWRQRRETWHLSPSKQVRAVVDFCHIRDFA